MSLKLDEKYIQESFQEIDKMDSQSDRIVSLTRVTNLLTMMTKK